MLTILPFCFALGFCVGYVLSEWRWRIWLRFRAMLQPVRTIQLEGFGVPLFVIISIGVLILIEELIRAVTTRQVLEIAAVVIGALATVWFRNEGRTRDQLAFIAGAGALLFLAALEYDNKLFRNLSKIGGSEFSVEFSEETRSSLNAPAPSAAPADQSYSDVAFPGASGIDYALGVLRDLPQSIVKDERYANLFYDSEHGSFRLQDISPSATYFIVYTCDHIVPFARKAYALQSFYRSETSILTINPVLVDELRSSYLRSRDWVHFDNGLTEAFSKDLLPNLSKPLDYSADADIENSFESQDRALTRSSLLSVSMEVR